MTTWDSTVDFVAVGSGGGGMVAALTAADAGASVLVLEKQPLVGGSTAMSGGVVWIPNNPVMASLGVADSFEDAMAHFEAVVGDVGPASSDARRRAFLTAGPEMVSFLQDSGVRFAYCSGYSDYYSEAKGGHDEGRAAVATHPILSDPACDRLNKSNITEIVTTNTIPLRAKTQAELTKLRALSVASLLAEAVKRIHNEESVSSLFA